MKTASHLNDSFAVWKRSRFLHSEGSYTSRSRSKCCCPSRPVKESEHGQASKLEVLLRDPTCFSESSIQTLRRRTATCPFWRTSYPLEPFEILSVPSQSRSWTKAMVVETAYRVPQLSAETFANVKSLLRILILASIAGAGE